MRLLEVYGPTIQGEGLDVGKPLIIARTAGCGIGCAWCDTKYSWAFDQTPDISPIDAAQKVIEHCWKTGIRSVLVTGGEPLQQPHGELNRFLTILRHETDWLGLETSGVPRLGFIPRILNRLTISPKLSSSKAKARLDASGLNDWLKEWREELDIVQIKYVIADRADFWEAVKQVEEVKTIKWYGVPIVFQPEASVVKEVASEIWDWVRLWENKDAYDWRLIPQVHKVVNLP